MTEKQKAFLIDLKQVLEKHNAEIIAVAKPTKMEGYGEPSLDIEIQDSEGITELGYLCPETIFELLIKTE